MRLKSIIIILLSVLSFSAIAQNDVKKVAILETVDKEDKIDYGIELMLRAALSSAITNTQGFEGYDRVDIQQITSEQNFQRTGMVSDADIKQIGNMTGAKYVLVSEVAQLDASHLVITSKILDVETAKVAATAYETMGTASNELENGCRKLAAKLLGNNDIQTNESAQRNIDSRNFVEAGSGTGGIGNGNKKPVYLPETPVKENGQVKIRVLVGKDGFVKEAEIVPNGTTITNSAIHQECLAKAKQAKFQQSSREEYNFIIFK